MRILKIKSEAEYIKSYRDSPSVMIAISVWTLIILAFDYFLAAASAVSFVTVNLSPSPSWVALRDFLGVFSAVALWAAVNDTINFRKLLRRVQLYEDYQVKTSKRLVRLGVPEKEIDVYLQKLNLSVEATVSPSSEA